MQGSEFRSPRPKTRGRASDCQDSGTPVALLQQVITNPPAFLGNRPLGAIVFCANNLADYGDKAPLLQAFVAKRKVLGEFGGCEVREPSQ